MHDTHYFKCTSHKVVQRVIKSWLITLNETHYTTRRYSLLQVHHTRYSKCTSHEVVQRDIKSRLITLNDTARMRQPVPWKMRLYMLNSMVIEILNGGEILVNRKFKSHKNVNLNLYRKIARNSNPIKISIRLCTVRYRSTERAVLMTINGIIRVMSIVHEPMMSDMTHAWLLWYCVYVCVCVCACVFVCDLWYLLGDFAHTHTHTETHAHIHTWTYWGT